MYKSKCIALVAHDGKKKDLLDWVKYNKNILREHKLITTGTTGKLIKEKFGFENIDIKLSGPLGGDASISSMIAENKIDMLVFFTDTLNTHPHIDDIGALQRIAITYNIIICCNKTTADYVISSPLFESTEYKREIPDFGEYLNRKINI